MPATTTASKSHSSGLATSLTFSHTSDTNPLFVCVSLNNNAASITTTLSVTYGGVAMALGGDAQPFASNGNQSDRIAWYRLFAPSAGAANVVVSSTGSCKIAAAAVNLSGWPTDISDILFVSDADRRDLREPSQSITTSTGSEVLDWTTYNDPNQSTTVLESGQTELYTLDGSHPGTLDQRQAGSIRTGLAGSTAMSWNYTTGFDYWTHGILSFVVTANAVPIDYEDPCTIEQPELFATVDTGTGILKVGIKGLRHSAALGGYAEPRLLELSDVTRAASDPSTGALPAQTATMKWADTDHEMRDVTMTRFGFRNADTAIYLTSRAQALVDGPPRLLMAGKMRGDDQDPNLVQSFEINDLLSVSYSLFAEEKLIPQRQIDRNWFPGAPEASVGLGEPIVGGYRAPLSPDNASADASRHEGIVSAITVGRLNVGGTHGTPTATTLASIVASLNASGATSTIYTDWGPTIGYGDSITLQSYYDSNGTVPTDYDGLAQIIGYSDLDYLLSQTAVTGGSEYVAALVASHPITTILNGTNGDPSVWIDDLQLDPAQLGVQWWAPQIPGDATWAADITTDLFTDITGSDGTVRRYTLILFATGSTYGDLVEAGGRVHLDCLGFEDVGDGSGNAIQDCFQQYKHLMKNFLLGDYQSGAWLAGPTFTFADGLTVLDRIHEVSFDTATTVATTQLAGGRLGSFTISARTSIRDIITTCNQSWGCLLAQDDYQRLFIKVLNTNRNEFYTNATGSVHRTLRDKIDFLPGFRLEKKPDWHVNYLRYEYAKNDYAGSFERGAGGGGSKMAVKYQVGIDRDGLLEKTLTLDFVRDDLTALTIAGNYRDLFANLPRVAHYERRGLCSLEDDVLDGVPIYHFNALNVNGTTGDAFWVLEKTFTNYHCAYAALYVEPLINAIEHPPETIGATDPFASIVGVMDQDATTVGTFD